jgi:hypothetical protein
MSAQTTALSLPADRARVLRRAGGVGVAAGVLFASMSVWEHAADLDSGATGLARDVSQGGFALAMVGYVVLLLGVHIARPGGDGRAARTFTALVGLAWIAFLASMAVAAVAGGDSGDSILSPLAGLAQGIGLVGMGVTTARAGRWTGWRRFMPLGLAVVYVAVLFVPAIAGADPSALAESVWALGYSGLGLALLSEQSHRTALSRGQFILGALVVAAVITSAAVVTF